MRLAIISLALPLCVLSNVHTAQMQEHLQNSMDMLAAMEAQPGKPAVNPTGQPAMKPKKLNGSSASRSSTSVSNRRSSLASSSTASSTAKRVDENEVRRLVARFEKTNYSNKKYMAQRTAGNNPDFEKEFAKQWAQELARYEEQVRAMLPALPEQPEASVHEEAQDIIVPAAPKKHRKGKHVSAAKQPVKKAGPSSKTTGPLASKQPKAPGKKPLSASGHNLDYNRLVGESTKKAKKVMHNVGELFNDFEASLFGMEQPAKKTKKIKAESHDSGEEHYEEQEHPEEEAHEHLEQEEHEDHHEDIHVEHDDDVYGGKW